MAAAAGINLVVNCCGEIRGIHRVDFTRLEREAFLGFNKLLMFSALPNQSRQKTLSINYIDRNNFF